MQTPELSPYWMPFTANRQYKSQPRLLERAKDMHYYDQSGRAVLDGTAGLWCCNAGHNRSAITQAIQSQADTLDYAPSFQMGHPLAFEAAKRLVDMAPDNLTHAFFANSGSEAVDSAMKIALAYHAVNGQPQRTRFIGRHGGYHGVGFGGISVGGLVNNRRQFGHGLSGVDHLPSLKDPKLAFTKGQSNEGADKADHLIELIGLHGADTIAAVIVEPVQGSAGVIVPPEGYLQRLREHCDAHGILLILDEVITGFGRLGAPFAAQRFDVRADLITCAKGLTSGTVPMGAVLVDQKVHDTMVNGAPEGQIELFHGYTYSGHPLAAASAIATLELYQHENLFDRARELEGYWESALHSLRELDDGIVDIRNLGLMGAVEFEPSGGTRAYRIFENAFFEQDLLVRASGDFIVMSPPLILTKADIDQIVTRLGKAIQACR